MACGVKNKAELLLITLVLQSSVGCGLLGQRLLQMGGRKCSSCERTMTIYKAAVAVNCGSQRRQEKRKHDFVYEKEIESWQYAGDSAIDDGPGEVRKEV